MSEALRDYFRRLDRSLDCPRPLRRRLAAQVRRAAEDYCRERPEAGPAEVVQYLGDPAETARELLDGLDPEELDRARRRERGYDQAFLLANAAALALGGVAVETLRKERHTRAQSSLEDASARRANVLGAYEIVDPELIEGRRVLLVDDVITTGATISECARILRTFGAADVVCATLARAH